MSVIHETVFEDRLNYVDQLCEMGAHIEVYGCCLGEGSCRFRNGGHRHSAVVRGSARLHGTKIHIPDLRAGFTYLLAAIIAEGESVISGVEELDRGYESVDTALSAAGATIVRVDEGSGRPAPFDSCGASVAMAGPKQDADAVSR